MDSGVVSVSSKFSKDISQTASLIVTKLHMGPLCYGVAEQKIVMSGSHDQDDHNTIIW